MVTLAALELDGGTLGCCFIVLAHLVPVNNIVESGNVLRSADFSTSEAVVSHSNATLRFCVVEGWRALQAQNWTLAAGACIVQHLTGSDT